MSRENYAFTYSRMQPLCFRLINMSDHNLHPPFCLKLVLKMDLIALHAPPSLRLLVRLSSPSFSSEATRSLSICPFSCVTRRPHDYESAPSLFDDTSLRFFPTSHGLAEPLALIPLVMARRPSSPQSAAPC